MSEKFSASKAKRLMNCHASGNLELAIPGWTPPVDDPTANNAANRGSHMHTIFAAANQLPPNDTQLLGEAIDYAGRLRKKRRFKALVEQPMQADWLLSKPWTTADLVLHVTDELHILDLKTGVIPVSAVENEQLMFYAVTYGHLAPRAKEVHLHIVQPWADVVEEWVVRVQRLAQFQAEAQAAELAVLSGDTTFMPGDHCTFCPANPHNRTGRGHPLCPAMMQLYYPSVDVDVDALLDLGEA